MRMDATTTNKRSKRHGYFGRKNQRKSCGKRRHKSCKNAWRIYAARRIYAKARRKTEGSTRS